MSTFGDMFAVSRTKLIELLSDSATYKTKDGATKTIDVIFNEQVGALDDFANAVFTFSSDATVGISDPVRGDQIIIFGGTWTVVDVRDDKAGTVEVRAMQGSEVS